MKIFTPLFLVCAFFTSTASAEPESELIARALDFAKESNEGSDITESFYKHCRERALTFSTTPPPVGRSENLNEVRIEQIEDARTLVTFIHYGSAYDGYNCKVTVALNREKMPVKVTTEILK